MFEVIFILICTAAFTAKFGLIGLVTPFVLYLLMPYKAVKTY